MSGKKRRSTESASAKKQARCGVNFSTAQEAIKFLEKRSNERNLASNVNIKRCLKFLTEVTSSSGLSPKDLDVLVKLITSSDLSDSIKIKLVKLCIPSTYVSFEAIENFLSHISSRKVSLNLKAKLFEYIDAVYEFIQPNNSLHTYYDVIFHFIDYETLCPYACHLLFLITEKEDVKPFWVRRLKSVEQIMGSQPHIMSLKSLFQLYRPDLVTLQSNSNKNYFKKSRYWVEKMHITKNSSVNHVSLNRSESRLFSIHHGVNNNNLSSILSDQKDLNIIPPVRYANSYDCYDDLLPFHQVKTFNKILKSIHKIQLPCQIVSLLKYRAMRMVLLNKDDETIVHRLSFWIENNMLRNFVFNKQDEKYQSREELLDILLEYSEDIQEGIPCIEEVLTQYLVTWNGLEHRSKIFALLSRWRMCPFDQIQSMVIGPISKLFIRTSLFFKSSAISSLTKMIHNMAMIELARYSCFAFNKENPSKVKKIDFRSLFPIVYHGNFDVLESFMHLIEAVASLCDIGLRLHNFHPLLFHQVLCFYEEVGELYTSFGIPKCFVMSQIVAYHGLFSTNAMFVSRIMNLLVGYKHLAEFVIKDDNYLKNIIKVYEHDFIACLWKNEAFKVSSSSRLFSNKSKASLQKFLKNSDLARKAFSFAHHPAFANYSVSFTNEITENKNKFVSFMSERGYHGLSKLLKTMV